MSRSVSGDGERVIVTDGAKAAPWKYHTDPTCRCVAQMDAHRTVTRSQLPVDAEECSWCAGDYATLGTTNNLGPNAEGPGTCKSCGARLEDGDCPFCSWYDAVHGLPAEVDWAWFRQFVGVVGAAEVVSGGD